MIIIRGKPTTHVFLLFIDTPFYFEIPRIMKAAYAPLNVRYSFLRHTYFPLHCSIRMFFHVRITIEGSSRTMKSGMRVLIARALQSMVITQKSEVKLMQNGRSILILDQIAFSIVTTLLEKYLRTELLRDLRICRIMSLFACLFMVRFS